jgi:hypothetical protein
MCTLNTCGVMVVVPRIVRAQERDEEVTCFPHCSRLGGVVVCVLPLDPKVAGSNPAKAMDF